MKGYKNTGLYLSDVGKSNLAILAVGSKVLQVAELFIYIYIDKMQGETTQFSVKNWVFSVDHPSHLKLGIGALSGFLGVMLSSNMVSCFRSPLKLWVLSQMLLSWRSWSSREGISPFHQPGAGIVDSSTEGNIFWLSRIWLDYDSMEFPVGVPRRRNGMVADGRRILGPKTFQRNGCDFTDLWPSDFCGEVFWHQMRQLPQKV